MTITPDSQNAIQDNNISRLYWQCRRGMLELDLLLLNFMDNSYQLLNTQQKNAFEILLKSPDQLLFDYFLGDTIPFDKDVADVVKNILDTSRNQDSKLTV